MNTLNIVVPIVAAGAAMALAALARLTRIGLPSMPKPVAFAMLLTGFAVIAFGLASPVLLSEPQPEPRIALHPETPAPQTDQDQPPDAETPPPAPADGTITGKVLAADSAPLADAAVTLERFARTQLQDSSSVVTAADGTFTFEGLATGSTDAYVVSTEFASTRFSSDIVVLSAGKPEPVVLKVAETTSDESVVSVTVDSTVIAGDQAALQVLQILSVKISGTKAYAGGLELPLLNGASGFEPRRGLTRMSLAFSDDKLVTNQPIPPGNTEIVFVYFLPGPGESATLIREATYPTKRLEILSSDPVAINSEQMSDAGRVKISDGGDGTYRRLVARNLKSGQKLESTITIAKPSNVARTAGIAAAVILALGIIAFPLVRRRHRTQPAPDKAVDAE